MLVSCVAQHNLLRLLVWTSNESYQLNHKFCQDNIVMYLLPARKKGSSRVVMSAVSEASNALDYVLISLSVTPRLDWQHVQLQTQRAVMLAAVGCLYSPHLSVKDM